jgi:formylmethanofuran dehydrogenase subunit E
MKDLQTLLAESAARHHHLCPRQVLGVRMGLMAGELLDLEMPHPDKRLFTFVETDGCGLDGISVATGCSVGRRTMRVIDFGKMAATFVDVATGESIRIVPSAESRIRAKEYMSESSNRWEAQLYAYQVMPLHYLFTVTPVALTVSLSDIISTHGLRVQCELCGEEIMNAREETVDGKVVCRGCAGQAYYAVADCSQRKEWSKAS